LEESVGQVEREGRAISLLPGFEIVEEPTDVGEEEVADLGLVLERGLDFRKRIHEVPVLVGKGKRGADLLEAGSVLPFSQEPIGLQGSRERQSSRIETCGRRPGEERPPNALVGSEAVNGKVSASRAFDQVGRKPLNVTPLGAVLFIFHKHGGI
jgi:hypothetical protein